MAWFGHKAQGRGFLTSAALVLVSLVPTGCGRGMHEPSSSVKLDVRISNFRDGLIPKSNTCDGGGASPELSWSEAPAGTQSFAITATDENSLFGYGFVHWVLYNLPPSTRQIPEAMGKQEQLPDGSRQGINDNDGIGYMGPCPPGKSFHKYDFVVYAVDTTLTLPSPATKKQLLQALRGHVLAKGDVEGRYRR